MLIFIVPVCTADRIRTVFDSNRTEANLQFEIISNPEFLAEVILIEAYQHNEY
jgi:UDP-glucose 6-dehydrogenase